MKELITDARFSVFLGLACAAWTVGSVLFSALSRQRGGLVAALAGPAAYLLWLAYSALAPMLDITRVSGVLILVMVFAGVGAALGWVLWRGAAGTRGGT